MKHIIPLLAFLMAAVLMFSSCNNVGNTNGGTSTTTPVATEVTTPETTTPEATTPEVTTPEVTTPEVSVPEETTPEATTPEESVPQVTTPEVTTPIVVIPVVTVPAQTQPEETTPEEETIPEPVELDPACEHQFTKRIVLEQVTTEEDGKIANVCGKCGGWQEEVLGAVKSLKILAIGNSFSNNALEYLPILARELGIEEIIVGKLYRGSCTVDRHWSDAQTGADYESFQVNKTGDANWITYAAGQRSLNFALQLYDWDIITFQQASGTSGMESSLGNLQNLIDFVNARKTNPNAKLYWHMTWAYSQFSNHGSFPNYDKDQIKMFFEQNRQFFSYSYKYNLECALKIFQRKLKEIVVCGDIAQSIFEVAFEDKLKQEKTQKSVNVVFVEHPAKNLRNSRPWTYKSNTKASLFFSR